MALIDTYVAYLTKFNATAIVLDPGKNVVVRLPAGDRPASQQVTPAIVQQILEESAATDVLAAVTMGQRVQFSPKAARAVLVTAEPAKNGTKLTIEPGEPAQKPAPTIAAPLPVAAPSVLAPPPQMQAAPTVLAPPPQMQAAPQVMQPPVMQPPVMQPPQVMQAPVQQVAHSPPAPVVNFTPGDTSGMDKLLSDMKKMGASDLHMSCTMPPLVRLHGEMKPVPGYPVLTPEKMLELLYPICPDKNRREFEERNDTDFAYSIPKVSRFRANMFRDRHGPGGVFRAIPFQLLTPEQLGLPTKVLDLCYLTKGLVVVTGPTGSGKSTTLSTLVNYINEHRSDHIITIEDPIEFVHENKKCLVNQREVNVHTRSFKDALRAALREDPDIVLVGEMRDLETVAIAVETAETGHLVFGTLHTTTAPSTVDRIIDQFPTDRQSQVRQMLAESLRGVIAQTLCKKIGGGRVAAYEILIGNSGVSNLIRQAKTFQLFSLMQTSRNIGMVTLNDSLIEHVKGKRVEPLEAYMKSVQKAEMKAALEKLGHKLDLQELPE